MPRLKVLMLGWEFPPIINGGLGIACLGISKAISKHTDLSIILPKSDPSFVVDNVDVIGLNQLSEEVFTHEVTKEKYSTIADVSYIPTSIAPYETGGIEVLSSETKDRYHWYSRPERKELDVFRYSDLYGEDVLYKVSQYAKYAVKIASTKSFDVIHAHDWMTFLAGIEIKKMSGKPLVLHVHSLSYDRGGPDSRGWIYDIEKEALELADAIIPVSHYTGSLITGYLGIDASKVFPIHNGVEYVEAFRQKKPFPEKLVLFLGRITIQKGPEIFLEIASKVLAKNKKVRFVMAGTGDKLKRVIESGAYKYVGDKFHFTGFLNKELVNRLLSMADVYCMPSVSEPFGLSALEAAQFGIPTVISKQSGAAEVMHSALKADFWDVDLMAKHILDLIEKEEIHERVVSEGYDDLAKLTWEECANKIMDVYQSTVVLS